MADALAALEMPTKGRLFSGNAAYISQEIRRNAVALGINANQGALIDWYHAHVAQDGRDFERASGQATPAKPPTTIDETGIDPGLWAHIAGLVADGDWGKVASQTAIFTEDRVRNWSGRPRNEVGEKLMSAVFGEHGVFPLGSNDGERQGWHRLAMGISMALRNVDAHHIQNRENHKRYAIGVVGTSSLLLTQVRFEYGDRLDT